MNTPTTNTPATPATPVKTSMEAALEKAGVQASAPQSQPPPAPAHIRLPEGALDAPNATKTLGERFIPWFVGSVLILIIAAVTAFIVRDAGVNEGLTLGKLQGANAATQAISMSYNPTARVEFQFKHGTVAQYGFFRNHFWRSDPDKTFKVTGTVTKPLDGSKTGSLTDVKYTCISGDGKRQYTMGPGAVWTLDERSPEKLQPFQAGDSSAPPSNQPLTKVETKTETKTKTETASVATK